MTGDVEKVVNYLRKRYGEEATGEDIEVLKIEETGGLRYTDIWGQEWHRPPGFPPGMEFRAPMWGKDK